MDAVVLAFGGVGLGDLLNLDEGGDKLGRLVGVGCKLSLRPVLGLGGVCDIVDVSALCSRPAGIMIALCNEGKGI